MASKNPSKNVARLNEDIRRALVDIIGEMRDPRLKAGLLTITRVDTDPDLTLCKVYVSILGQPAEKKAAIVALEGAKGHVRSEVSSRMHIRRAPEFQFVEDDNAEYAAHINELLGKL